MDEKFREFLEGLAEDIHLGYTENNDESMDGDVVDDICLILHKKLNELNGNN